MRAWLLILVAVVACKKDTGGDSHRGEPPSTADADALWKLAPPGTTVGVVASPRALQMVEHAWQDIHAFIAKSPELAVAAQALEQQLQKLPTGQDLTFAAAGLSTQKGGAVFVGKTDKEMVTIVPLGDRDKFLAITHGKKGDKEDVIPGFVSNGLDGTCVQTHGVYACGTRDMVDKLGGGDIQAGLAAVHARGDVEIVVHDVANAPPGLAVAAVIQMERGGVTIRGSIAGAPKQILAKLGDGAKPRTEDDHATGFGVLNAKMWLKLAAGDDLPLPREPLVAGVTAADIVKAIDDPITLTTYNGGFDARIPLNDKGPFEKLLAQCDILLAPLGGKTINGACHVPIPSSGIAADVWLDGKELHFGNKGSKPSGATALTPLGKELADTKWLVALWGHGTIYEAGKQFSDQIAQIPIPDMANTLIRVMTTINEIGFGVRVDDDQVKFVIGARTIWSNPDAVVAKILAIAPADVIAGKGLAAAKQVADGAAQTPFANDVNGGYSGMMMPTAAIGVMAAVAIPAFLDYMKKSKKSEASLQLNRIGKSLKRYYAENSTFPKGDAGPATATGCCGGASPTGVVDNKCRPDPAAAAKDPIWSALEFMPGEATLYQYRYHSDGQTATVEAIGDVDCDGALATFTLDVKTNAGVPVLDLRSPPAGVY